MHQFSTALALATMLVAPALPPGEQPGTQPSPVEATARGADVHVAARDATTSDLPERAVVKPDVLREREGAAPAFLESPVKKTAPTPDRSLAGQVGTVHELGGTRFAIWGGVKSAVMPKAVEVSEDGEHVFVAHIGHLHEKNVAVFRADPLTRLGYLNYEGSAIELAEAPKRGLLLSSNMFKAGFLDIFEYPTFRHLSHFRIRGMPKVITVGPKSEYVYLSLWQSDAIVRWRFEDGTIERIDMEPREARRDDAAPVRPRGMVFSPDGERLFTANNFDRTISVIDVSSFEELRRIYVGHGPRELVISERRNRLYVTLSGLNRVAEIDLDTEQVVRKFTVGKLPKGLTISHDDRFLYVGNYKGSSLQVVDLDSGESLEIPMNLHKLSGVAVHPSDEFIYVTGWCSSDVWAIQRLDDPNEAPKVGPARNNEPCKGCVSRNTGCPSRDEFVNARRERRLQARSR